MYIVIAIIIFGVLIVAHELGHFMSAKICGIRVLEFSIGMGPKLLKRQGKETLYSLRAFPIGGFCAMEGEDENSDDPRAFTSQPVWKRFVVLVSGSLMNFLVGLLIIVLLIVSFSSNSYRPAVVTGFAEGCPYEGTDGIMVGDTIYKINGERIYFSSNVSFFMSRVKGSNVTIELIREGKRIVLEDYHMVPVEYIENGETVVKYGLVFGQTESGVTARFKYAWYYALDCIRLIRLSLADLITGAVGAEALSGPVGIVKVINDVGQEAPTAGIAAATIANLAAFISINLAVFNLLPIPALDGGRILFMIITWIAEKLTRRKINPKYEGYVHAAFLVMFLGLMAFVMFNDIMRIVSA